MGNGIAFGKGVKGQRANSGVIEKEFCEGNWAWLPSEGPVSRPRGLCTTALSRPPGACVVLGHWDLEGGGWLGPVPQSGW